ncbi:hypothetical protein [Halapricum desulfuricans]|uniref:hypothetical protein n=1 Tax=Halapricum desulfuricans TaxID=2841257 RepID=UPI001E3AEBF0|nr:hypothetical protein [Halapricum desulfuricans]
MTKRRKFLLGMGSLAAGGAAAIGSGAFTSVSADRGMAVQVADDAEAFLAIEPQDTPNGNEYADVGSDGTVSLDFTNTNETQEGDYSEAGQGLNKDATTIIRDVLKVTNLGTQPVVVSVSVPSEPNMSVYTDDSELNYIESKDHSSSSLNANVYGGVDGGNLPVVEPGETMNDVGFSFRDPPDDLDLSEATLTFNAIALDETGLDYDPSS